MTGTASTATHQGKYYSAANVGESTTHNALRNLGPRPPTLSAAYVS